MNLPTIALFPGGRVQSVSIPRSTSSYELTGLRPNTDYIINLYTLYEDREEATPVSTTPRGQQLNQGPLLTLNTFINDTWVINVLPF